MKRDTTKDLFEAVIKLVKENTDFNESFFENRSSWMHVYDSRRYRGVETIEITKHNFEFKASVQYGSNEGVLILCEIEGEIVEDETVKRITIGSIKNHGEDKKTLVDMGAIAGLLTYYANQYLDENIDRY